MFRRLWDVHNKYKAELVVSYSWWMKKMLMFFTDARRGDKPRPSQSVATLMAWTRQMVGRVNARVLGDATNRVSFGVNVPLVWVGRRELCRCSDVGVDLIGLRASMWQNELYSRERERERERHLSTGSAGLPTAGKSKRRNGEDLFVEFGLKRIAC